MAGRRRIAAPGQPQCPAPDCERPAGFATDHDGHGLCRRHEGSAHRPAATATPEATRRRPRRESEPEAGPLARRLTGSRVNPDADPLAVLRRVLASARCAGYPFEQAWAIGAEAALSYMSSRRAEEGWDTLTATERAWAEAYAHDGSRLAGFREDFIRA